MCFSNQLGQVWIWHANTEVFVCFLLGWWIDLKWSILFEASLRSTFSHLQGCRSPLHTYRGGAKMLHLCSPSVCADKTCSFRPTGSAVGKNGQKGVIRPSNVSGRGINYTNGPKMAHPTYFCSTNMQYKMEELECKIILKIMCEQRDHFFLTHPPFKISSLNWWNWCPFQAHTLVIGYCDYCTSGLGTRPKKLSQGNICHRVIILEYWNYIWDKELEFGK